MATRHLTMVICGGETKIAQYGHFDGYPSGVGTKLLKLLHRSDAEVIPSRLHYCKVMEDSEYRRFFKGHALDEKALEDAYPHFWWYDGADLLEMLLDRPHEVDVLLNAEFANDSLQCEWAYVLDYDARTFEVYKGWNKMPLPSTDRFYNNGYADGENYPVRLAQSFSLDALPTVGEFEAIHWEELWVGTHMVMEGI